MSDWKNESFFVGNNEIPYIDVESYDFKYDSNGNPVYKIVTEQGSTYSLTGSQAYAFDPTRVLSNYDKRRLIKKEN